MKSTVLKRRQLKFDEINALGRELTEWSEDIPMPQEEIEKRKNRFHDCLIDFLIDGFAAGLLFIGEDKDLPNPYQYLNKEYSDGETVDDKFMKYLSEAIKWTADKEEKPIKPTNNTSEAKSQIATKTSDKSLKDKSNSDKKEEKPLGENPKGMSPADKMQRLAEAEANRMFNTGELVAVEGKKGKKTWETMGDNRVRFTHDYLEGMTIDMKDEFITIDGDAAQAPGLFENPENNVNCRCWLTFSKE